MAMEWTRCKQRRGFAFALLMLTAAPAAAQTYPFQGPRLKTDGTAVLVQDYTCQPAAVICAQRNPSLSAAG